MAMTLGLILPRMLFEGHGHDDQKCVAMTLGLILPRMLFERVLPSPA